MSINTNGCEFKASRTPRRCRLICIFVGLFGCFVACSVSGSPALAQSKPEIRAEVDSTEMFVGEGVTLQVDLLNVSRPSPPDIKELEELFSVEVLGEQSLNQLSMMSINGRVTRQEIFRHVYQYKLTPKQAGTLTISPLIAEVDGVILKSNSIELRVSEIPQQEDVVAEIVVEPKEIYPTQSFQVKLQIYVRGLPDRDDDPLVPLRRRPPHLTVPWVDIPDGLKSDDTNRWLGNLRADRNVGFTINDIRSNGFLMDSSRGVVFDLMAGREKRKLKSGEEVEYFRYELTRNFLANRIGEYSFGPVVVKGTFVVGAESNEYVGKRIVAIAPAVAVNVKEVPTPRPINFIGGIGDYEIKVSASPTRLRVGDPMTLTMDVLAKGSSESSDLISAPDLSQNEAIARDFDVIDKEPVGKSDGKVKSFSYGLRPKSVGVSIPPLSFSTFDARREVFTELLSASVPLEVSEAKSIDKNLIVGTRRDKLQSMEADKSGVFQGSFDMYPIQAEDPDVRVWFGFAGGSWLVAIASLFWIRHRRQSLADGTVLRRSRAKGAALGSLDEAQRGLEGRDYEGAIASVRKAIVELVADCLDLPPRGLTTDNILEHLSDYPLSKELRESLMQLLGTLDAAQYGGVSPENVHEMLGQSRLLIEPLYDCLGKKVTAHKSAWLPGSMVILLLALQSQRAVLANDRYSVDESLSYEQAIADFQRAASASEFERAATQLEMIRDRGVRGGAIYFHLGNAWYRAGNIGKSLANYRFASFYMPTDPYLKANLAQALASAPNQGEFREDRLLPKLFFWSNWISYPNKIRVSAVVCILASVFFLLFVVRSHYSLLYASISSLLLGALIGAEGWIHSPDAFARGYGVVVRETVARKGMGENYGPAFVQPLQDGAEFDVLQSTSHWTLGRFPGIGDGWIDNQAIELGDRAY